MPDPNSIPLRLYESSHELFVPGPAPPEEVARFRGDPSLVSLGRELADRETLRPVHFRRLDLEPLSLPWYLALEQIRHQRQGRWLPKLLEFGKHQGERLLGLGCGLGSDLIQYASAGAEVIAVSNQLEQLALIRRNFELRGLTGSFLRANPKALPIESSSIDVVVLHGLLSECEDPTPLIDEVYRVLKPGGKLLAVVPSHYDVEYWSKTFLLGSRKSDYDPFDHHRKKFRARHLRQQLARFMECRIWKRHLRRGEVPHLWRWVPLSLLERLIGRFLVFKGFKPVSAARSEQLAA